MEHVVMSRNTSSSFRFSTKVATRLLHSYLSWSLVVAATCVVAAGCSAANAKGETASGAAVPAAVSVKAVAAVQKPIARFLRVTGTLMAEGEAQVAAETAGRVMDARVERGTRVARGGELITISATESQAQVDEAQANAAQIEARLGMANGSPFEIDKVPEVANARASHELADTELDRARMLS